MTVIYGFISWQGLEQFGPSARGLDPCYSVLSTKTSVWSLARTKKLILFIVMLLTTAVLVTSLN